MVKAADETMGPIFRLSSLFEIECMGRDQLASGALYHLPLPAWRQTWNTGLHSDDLYWPTADGALPLKWVGILVNRHVEVSPLESARDNNQGGPGGRHCECVRDRPARLGLIRGGWTRFFCLKIAHMLIA